MLSKGQKWALAIVGALILIGGGTAVSFKVRGLRNNNPGNLRLTGINWQGKVPNDQNTDGEFEQFYNAEDGVRAMARDLLTGYRRGENTIRKIINQYAPNTENNTTAYIQSVVSQTGVPADATYPPAKILDLVKAIIKHENGINPYGDQMLERAVERAGWA